MWWWFNWRFPSFKTDTSERCQWCGCANGNIIAILDSWCVHEREWRSAVVVWVHVRPIRIANAFVATVDRAMLSNIEHFRQLSTVWFRHAAMIPDFLFAVRLPSHFHRIRPESEHLKLVLISIIRNKAPKITQIKQSAKERKIDSHLSISMREERRRKKNDLPEMEKFVMNKCDKFASNYLFAWAWLSFWWCWYWL